MPPDLRDQRGADHEAHRHDGDYAEHQIEAAACMQDGDHRAAAPERSGLCCNNQQ
ncbi:hypothetical protein HC776_01525 [bacterium]|nr:hypothetical protein [bacterium]